MTSAIVEVKTVPTKQAMADVMGYPTVEEMDERMKGLKPYQRVENMQVRVGEVVTHASIIMLRGISFHYPEE